MTRGEYFIDQDPGVGNGTLFTFPPTDTLQDSLRINFNGVPVGYHNISFRFFDTLGVPSLTGHDRIYIYDTTLRNNPYVNAPISYVEYFFDGQDPGLGLATPFPVSIADTINLQNVGISADSLSLGNHTISIRAMDTLGRWSHIASQTIFICTEYAPEAKFAIDVDRNRVFLSDSSRFVESYLWDLGDGTTDTTVNPSHTYQQGSIYNIRLITSNPCGIDTAYQQVGIVGVKDYFPKFHANSSYFPFKLEGFGFTNVTDIRFHRPGQADITPENIVHVNDKKLHVNFDVDSVDLGSYSIIVDFQGGRSDTFPHAFTFKFSVEPKIEVHINGPGRLLVNRPYNFQVIVENKGTRGAYGVPVFIHIKGKGVECTLENQAAALDSLINNTVAGRRAIAYFDSTAQDSGKVMALLIPSIPPGERFLINLEIKSRIGFHYFFEIEVKSLSPLLNDAIFTQNGAEFNSTTCHDNCIDCMLGVMGFAPYLGCVTSVNNIICNIFNLVFFYVDNDGSREDYDIVQDLLFEGSLLFFSCTSRAIPEIISKILDMIGLAQLPGVAEDCSECKAFNPSSPSSKKSKRQEVINSGDPNLKVGTLGFGPQNYTSSTELFAYHIFFENVDTATAPASEVVIYDTLDKNVLDLSTFKFTGYGFGDYQHYFERAQDSFVVDLDLRPAQPIILRISGQIDTLQGIATWRFISLDTVHLALTEIVSDGFLPPNMNKPEGEGFVSFRVDLQPSLPSGTAIDNEATIVFDYNDPITTPNWLNTIDDDSPVSRMDTLPPTVADSAIVLGWSGTDLHSGIRYDRIYVSTNNDSTFEFWQEVEDSTSVIFYGKVDSTYYFMCEAVDSVGNVEQKAFLSEASTQVIAVLATPTISALGNTRFCEGDSVVLQSDSIYTNYLWNTGDTTRQIVVKQAGNYRVVGGDGIGISPPSLYKAVQQDSLPHAPLITLSDSVVFCMGDSLQLSGPAGYSFYSWSTGQSDSIITVKNSLHISLQVGNMEGCESPPADTIITQVLPLPPKPGITLGSSLNFCEGDSIALTTSSASKYEWSTGDSTQSIWANKTFKITLRVTDTTGCWSPLSDTIHVNMLALPPKPQVTPSGSTMFCNGDSVRLKAPVGYSTYLWNNGSGASSISVTNSDSLWVSVMDSYGCESPVSDTVRVMVFPVPQKPIISPNDTTSFCSGDSVQLSLPSGFAGYRWSNGDTIGLQWVSTSVTMSAQVINAFGCSSPAADSVRVTVYPTPTSPMIMHSGPLSFCAGDSTVLNAPVGFASYLWSNGDTTSKTVIQYSGNYNLMVETAFGCSSPVSNSLAVTAWVLPTKPQISSSGPTTFCTGDSVKLNGPSGYSTYHWSSGDSIVDFWTFSSLIIQLQVSDSNGCQSPISDTMRVVVNNLPPQPNLSPAGPTSFCQGDSLLIQGPSGYPNYYWSTGDTISDIIVRQSSFVNLQVTDTNGCVSPASINLITKVDTLPSKPTIMVQGAQKFCRKDSVLLFAPSGFSMYSWSNGTTDSILIVQSAGTYVLQVIDSNGCESPMSDIVFIDTFPQVPIPQIMTYGELSICPGDSVQLKGPQGFATYSWSDGYQDSTRWVTRSDSFQLAVVDSNGCTSPYSPLIITTVFPMPDAPIIQIIGSLQFCEGDSLLLFTTPDKNSFLWSTGDTTPSILVWGGGDYYLAITDSNGCESPRSDTIQTQMDTLPGKPIIVEGPGQDQLHSSIPGTIYQWFRNDSLLGGETTRSILGNRTGIYRVVVFNNNCPSDTSDSFNFIKTKLEDAFGAAGYQLYPNPNNGVLIVEGPAKIGQSLYFEIFDAQGKRVYQKVKNVSAHNFQFQFELEHLASGTYWVWITSGNQRVGKNFIKK